MEGLQDDTKSRSMEAEASEQSAKKLSSVQPKPVAEAALVPPKVPESPPTAECSMNAAEMDDNDVFYDARSEDSGGGILPLEASDRSKKKETCIYFNRKGNVSHVSRRSKVSLYKIIDKVPHAPLKSESTL
ncbi:uncharacterized protein [Drosophila kikkawai]|uniref:Uncharacterized protein n=1 Tax=Drosophila kikkawai TaxID=30033 RepID=A0ABM4GHA3_DROKI